RRSCRGTAPADGALRTGRRDNRRGARRRDQLRECAAASRDRSLPVPRRVDGRRPRERNATDALGGSMSRHRILYVVVAVLAGCGKREVGGREFRPGTGAGAPPLPGLRAVTNTPAPAPTAVSDHKSTGTLLPHAEVAVVARASGVLVELGVDVGARVKKGQ